MKLLSRIKSLLRNSKKENSGFTLMTPDGLDETFLFDFKNYQSQYTGVTMNSFISVGGDERSDSDSGSPITNKKIAVKPKDVLEELETIPTPWTLSNLDDKTDLSNSVNFYKPSTVRKELYQLMRIKFLGGKAETHANFSLTIHPARIDYYLDLFSQHKSK